MFGGGTGVVGVEVVPDVTMSCVRATRTIVPPVPVIVSSYNGFELESVGIDKVETTWPRAGTRTVGGVKK